MWVLAVFIVAFAQGARGQDITVFAAASLRDALGDVEVAYEAANGGDVTLVFAASSAIARQVARGAPADVVLLADTQWSDWLVADGALEAAMPFAGNRLVLLSTEDAAIDIEDLPKALGDGVLAMAQVDAVPAGRYGKSALEALGLWEDIAPQVVQAANVRAALRFVQRGEAPFGIGYASDLRALGDLTLAYEFAADTHAPIVYSGGSVTPQGAEFMTYLQSAPAQAVLADWGFPPLEAQ